MTDREMLELAAKAAGVVLDGEWSDTDRMSVSAGGWWNPLTDDGDALRLAAQLGLEVSFVGDDADGRDSECSVGYPESVRRPCRIKYVFEPHRGDIFAATRRAIVRAAAAIQQAKERT